MDIIVLAVMVFVSIITIYDIKFNKSDDDDCGCGGCGCKK